jgi:hypothetical protein
MIICHISVDFNSYQHLERKRCFYLQGRNEYSDKQIFKTNKQTSHDKLNFQLTNSVPLRKASVCAVRINSVFNLTALTVFYFDTTA